ASASGIVSTGLMQEGSRSTPPSALAVRREFRSPSGERSVQAGREPEEREEPLGLQEERELTQPIALGLDDHERPGLVAAVGARLVLPPRRRAVRRPDGDEA